MNTLPRILAVGSLLALTAGLAVSCSGSPATTAAAPTAADTPTEHVNPDGAPGDGLPHGRFIDRFESLGMDYEVAPTFAALADQSTLVVTARLDEIREGKAVGNVMKDATRAEYLVYVFTVDKVLKGEHRAARLFVETSKPDLEPAAGYDAVKPAGAEAVLYLDPVPEPKPSPGAEIRDPRAGLDPGAVAYQPVTPQGLLLVEGGQVVHPMIARVPLPGMFPQESPAPSPTDLRTWLPAPLRAAAG